MCLKWCTEVLTMVSGTTIAALLHDCHTWGQSSAAFKISVHPFLTPRTYYNTTTWVYLINVVWFWCDNAKWWSAKMGDFDNTKFMVAECQKLYYSDLPSTKLLLKGGICLDKVEENLPTFHAQLTTTRWMCFSPDPCYGNEHWVCEFYVNLSIISLTNPVMMIWGKQVKFGVEKINEIYGLPDADMGQFQEKTYEPRTWMANTLCPGKEVLWVTTKRDILMNKFTIEDRL